MNSTRAADACSDAGSSMQLYLSTFWYLFLAATTAVGLLVSLVSNMIIIYLFTSTPSLRQNPSNIIAVNLSLSDLLYCIQWPSVIYCSLTQSTWILEIYPVCQVFGFITVSTGLASVLTVLVMSVERAFVIRNPLKAYPARLAWLINLLVWLLCLLSSLPPLFGRFNRFALDPSKTSCTLDYLSAEPNYKLYIVVLCLIYWVLPFLAISISYALIFVTFKRSSLTLASAARAGKSMRHRVRVRRAGSSQAHSYLGQQQQPNTTSTCTTGRQLRRASVSCEPPATSRRLWAPLSQQVSPSQNSTFFGGPLHSIELGALQLVQGLDCAAAAVAGKPTAGGRLNWRSRLYPGHLKAARHGSYSHLSRTRLQFRLARMSLYLILLWLISWTPLALLSLLNSLLHCHRVSAISIFVANTMTKLGPTFDVFIYGVSHPKIKSRFKQIIGRLLRRVFAPGRRFA